MKKERRIAPLSVIFICYFVLLFILLFFRQLPDFSSHDYTTLLAGNYNFTPFDTIDYFLKILSGGASTTMKVNALVNLIGNVIMFIPLGWYLPSRHTVMKKPFVFLPFSLSLIILVELTQFFTLLGYCDVDDLILNAAGMIMGYALYFAIGAGKTRKTGTNKK